MDASRNRVQLKIGKKLLLCSHTKNTLITYSRASNSNLGLMEGFNLTLLPVDCCGQGDILSDMKFPVMEEGISGSIPFGLLRSILNTL